jgi:deazaflavin-dependent oxidoreductase (nitroreductase family)
MVVSRKPDRARWTPPPWLNGMMTQILRTPGLQRWVGRTTALLTVEGRRSGRLYTTPVSFVRQGDRVVLTTHSSRRWWRNLHDRPVVGLRLGGVDRTGTAHVLSRDDPRALEAFRDFMEGQPVIARAERIGRDETGNLRAEDLRRILVDTIVIEVRLVEPTVMT